MTFTKHVEVEKKRYCVAVVFTAKTSLKARTFDITVTDENHNSLNLVAVPLVLWEAIDSVIGDVRRMAEAL
jgi:hypothetical protein